VPTYSYRCTECDNAFDIKQSFSDATLTECPVCGGVLRKVFSPVGVTFNRTDSRPAPKSEGSSSTPAKSETKATPAKTESKPSTPKPSAS
jgi:putative FmdB family regulatory protein